MLIKGFTDLELRPPPHLRDRALWNAIFKLDSDVSHLFPYINAEIKDSLYFDNPHHIRFRWEEGGCGLYSDYATAGWFEGRDLAVDYIWKIIDFLNLLDENKGSIKPDHRKFKHIPVLEIFKILPRTNCGKCGYPTCMAFAAAVSSRNASPEKCPDFTKPISVSAVYPVYDADGNFVSTVEIDSESSAVDPPTQEQKTPGPEKMNKVSGPYGENLTGREVQVLRLMAEGLTNTEISHMLSISSHTVKSHVVHIFNKLGVNDRTQAAVWAAKNKLL